MRVAAAKPERIGAPATGKTKMQRAGSLRLPPFAHQPFSLGFAFGFLLF
jgi:hypothetical protein